MIRTTLVVCIGIVLIACQPAPSPGLTAPGSTFAPASAPTSGLTWTKLDLPDAIGAWQAAGVIADASGFVVYGGVNDQPAVWTSVDATAWASVPLPGFHAFPSRAAVSETATVLLGFGGTDRCAHPFGEFLWSRMAGQANWLAAPFVEDLFCAGGSAQIAATRTSFVVAGTNAGEQPFAWQSATGLTWVDASHGLPLDAPPAVLTATDAGFLELARGERTDAEFSPNGVGWTSVPAPPVPPAFDQAGSGMSPAALIPTSQGILSVFEPDGDGAPSAWRRELDGSWTELAFADFGPRDTIHGGTAIGGRPYLFLRRPGAAAVLVSENLAEWSQIDTPRLDAILGLAAFDGRFVLIGSVNDANGDDHSQVFVATVKP